MYILCDRGSGSFDINDILLMSMKYLNVWLILVFVCTVVQSAIDASQWQVSRSQDREGSQDHAVWRCHEVLWQRKGNKHFYEQYSLGRKQYENCAMCECGWRNHAARCKKKIISVSSSYNHGKNSWHTMQFITTIPHTYQLNRKWAITLFNKKQKEVLSLIIILPRHINQYWGIWQGFLQSDLD